MRQEELADLIGVSFQTVNRLINGRQSLTPNLAMRLARLFGTSPDFWLNFQLRCDLYREAQAARAEIERIKPLGRTAKVAEPFRQWGLAKKRRSRSRRGRAV
jgi:addiction module HigA family antidote